jgi:hypothetical protein
MHIYVVRRHYAAKLYGNNYAQASKVVCKYGGVWYIMLLNMHNLYMMSS